jgi:NADPH:quinone reductase-like Zn-dependent oxidoreductase
VKSFEIRCIPEFETGKLRIALQKEFKMTEITQAMKMLEDNKAIGKIVLLNDL